MRLDDEGRLLIGSNKVSLIKLKETLAYNESTGLFTWLIDSGNQNKSGEIADTLKDGYVTIGIAGGRYYAHILAWFYMTGEWPTLQIDHADYCRNNNSWKNLRLATYGQNKQNTPVRSHSKTGVKGVCKIKNKFQARITIGTFDTPEEAAKAYKIIAKLIHKEFMHSSIKD